MEIGDKMCVGVFESCNEHDWYTVVVVKDGVVVRLLSQAASGILAELHVLSKGIIVELILSFRFKIFV